MFLTPIFGEKQNKTKKSQTPITKPIKKPLNLRLKSAIQHSVHTKPSGKWTGECKKNA